MKTKIKIIIISIALIGILSSCVGDSVNYNDKSTYSGYVALDFTSDPIYLYSSSLTTTLIFNLYYSQPTEAKRDSVDRLYFMNTKILREENGNSWTLRNINNWTNNDITIKTNGKTLDDAGAKWTISVPNQTIDELGVTLFEVEKITDGRWRVKNHVNRNYDFEYSSEWEISSGKIEEGITIEGKGSMLSFANPKLKLDFTITEPLEVKIDEYHASISSGIINILATDVDKKITEETTADILTENSVKISFKNKEDNWDYSLFLWWF